jgi:hypothetical protein
MRGEISVKLFFKYSISTGKRQWKRMEWFYLQYGTTATHYNTETPIIALDEKGRVTFFNDSMGAYPVMVQRIKIKNGGYVEFTTTG